MAFVAFHSRLLCSTAETIPIYNLQKLAAVAQGPGSGQYVYTSTDSGVSWIEQTNSGARIWSRIASSADGTVRLVRMRQLTPLSVTSHACVPAVYVEKVWVWRSSSLTPRLLPRPPTPSNLQKLAATVSGEYIWTSP